MQLQWSTIPYHACTIRMLYCLAVVFSQIDDSIPHRDIYLLLKMFGLATCFYLIHLEVVNLRSI